jgi:peptidoglycan/LPS O-acetylase OafA/YrhL
LASSPHTRIETLQVGRGLAALAVLLHHAGQSVDRLVGRLPDLISTVFAYGYLGVDFFFVLSGFIIYYVSHAHVADPHWPRRYAESRITRVYLPYLPISIAVGLAYTALPHMGSGENHWNWFSTLTLLPSTGGPALSPAWTLQHEVGFYAVAFVFLYLRKVWLGCILGAAAAIGFDLATSGTFKAFSMIDLEFIFGIFAAWCFIHRRVQWNPVLFLSGLVVAASFLTIGGRQYTVVFGLGVTLMLLPVVRAEVAGRLKVGKSLILLGDASFAIYLVHHPMVSVLVRMLSGTPPLVALAITVTVPLVAGILYHKIVEQPIIAAGRTAVARRHAQVA